MRRIFCLALVPLAVPVAACGGGGSTSVVAHQSAKQVLSTAAAAAKKSGSFRYRIVGTASGTKQTIVGDVSKTEGDETISSGTVEIRAEVIDKKAYIEGNAEGLVNEMGFSSSEADSIAGKWISVATTDSPYASITSAVILPGALTELEPAKPLSLTTDTTRGGHPVVGVRGGLPGGNPKTVTGTVVFYVSTVDPAVPLAFAAREASGGKTQSDVGTFTRWGRPVRLAVPTDTVALSSLPAATG